MLAVITGATSGIGRSFAENLAGRGYDLVLTGRRDELLSAVADRIRNSHGVSVRTIVGDLAVADTENLVIEAIESGHVEFLVNNAGSGLSSDFVVTDRAKLEQLHEILAGVPSRLIRAALPRMITARSGTIINVGSLAGRLAVPGSSVYVAAKTYLERLSETLALELYRDGVVVQALIPGYVRTDFHRSIPDYKRKQRNRGAIRWMEPDDVVRISMKAAERARTRLQRGRATIPRPRDVSVIPGIMNRLLGGLSRIVPRRLLYAAATNRKRLT
ncbi:MAG: SDR family NAD(P)-dependent oxidoreductase [Spirochaetia bacterium]